MKYPAQHEAKGFQIYFIFLILLLLQKCSQPCIIAFLNYKPILLCEDDNLLQFVNHTYKNRPLAGCKRHLSNYSLIGQLSPTIPQVRLDAALITRIRALSMFGKKKNQGDYLLLLKSIRNVRRGYGINIQSFELYKFITHYKSN